MLVKSIFFFNWYFKWYFIITVCKNQSIYFICKNEINHHVLTSISQNSLQIVFDHNKLYNFYDAFYIFFQINNTNAYFVTNCYIGLCTKETSWEISSLQPKPRFHFHWWKWEFPPWKSIFFNVLNTVRTALIFTREIPTFEIGF